MKKLIASAVMVMAVAASGNVLAHGDHHQLGARAMTGCSVVTGGRVLACGL
jgi:hypothetical protein